MRFLVLALTALTVAASGFIEDPDLDCWRGDQYLEMSERTLGGVGVLDREACERACDIREDCYAVLQYEYEDSAPYTPSMCYLSAREMCERVEGFRRTARAAGSRWFARRKPIASAPPPVESDFGKMLRDFLKRLVIL